MLVTITRLQSIERAAGSGLIDLSPSGDFITQRGFAYVVQAVDAFVTVDVGEDRSCVPSHASLAAY